MDRKLLNRIWRFLRIAIAVVVVLWIARIVVLQWREIRSVDLAVRVEWLPWGFLAILAFYLLYAQSWKRILHKVSAPAVAIEDKVLARIFFMSMVMRYLPAGKVINIGSRIELYRSAGGRRSSALTAVMIEQLYFVGGTVLLMAMALPFGEDILTSLDIGRYEFLIWIASLSILCLIIGFDWFHNLVTSKVRLPEKYQINLNIPLFFKLELVVRFLLVNLLQGLAAFLLLNAVIPGSGIELRLTFFTLAAYPFSRFLGQLVGVVPGGLGVREGAYALLMGANLPVTYALAAAGIMRFASILTELLVLLVLNYLLISREPVWETEKGQE